MRQGGDGCRLDGEGWWYVSDGDYSFFGVGSRNYFLIVGINFSFLLRRLRDFDYVHEGL
jgi:hypothetical protein